MAKTFTLAVGGVTLEIGAPEAWLPALRMRYMPFVAAQQPDWRVTLTHDPALEADETEAWIKHVGDVTNYRLLAYRGTIDLAARTATVSAPSAARAASSLERALVYILMQALPRHHNAILLHASAVVRDGRGHVFVGPSGAGKTTVARLSTGFGELLCDENVIVQATADGAVVHSTPFWGNSTPPELIRRVQRHAPLAGIYILAKTPGFELMRLSPASAVLALLGSEKVPVERANSAEVWLTVVEKLVAAVPVWQLGFRPTTELWDFLNRPHSAG